MRSSGWNISCNNIFPPQRNCVLRLLPFTFLRQFYYSYGTTSSTNVITFTIGFYSFAYIAVLPYSTISIIFSRVRTRITFFFSVCCYH